jgi:hypothetical protein
LDGGVAADSSVGPSTARSIPRSSPASCLRSALGTLARRRASFAGCPSTARSTITSLAGERDRLPAAVARVGLAPDPTALLETVETLRHPSEHEEEPMYPHVRQFETIDNLRRELRAGPAESRRSRRALASKRRKLLEPP